MKALKNKKTLSVLALIVLLLLGGTTYAWFTSRGVVSGGNFGLEKVKIEVNGLLEWRAAYVLDDSGEKALEDPENPESFLIEEQWVPLNSHTVILDEILFAQKARALLKKIDNGDVTPIPIAAPEEPEDPDAPEEPAPEEPAPEEPEPDAYEFFNGAPVTYDELVAIASKGRYMFTVENLGDHAYVYVNIGEMLGVELANNAYQIPPGEQADLVGYKPGYYQVGISTSGTKTGLYPDGVSGYPAVARTHIWFGDVADELHVELGNSGVDSDYDLIASDDDRYIITFDDVLDAIDAIEDEFDPTNSGYDPTGTEYEKAAEAYFNALAESKRDPSNMDLALDVNEKFMVYDNLKGENDVSVNDPSKAALDSAIKKYNDYLLLKDAMMKAGAAVGETDDAIGSSIVIRNSWLNVATAFDTDGNPTSTRPLTLDEVSALLKEESSYETGSEIDELIGSNGNDEYTQSEYKATTRNIVLTTEIQYGDTATQVATVGVERLEEESIVGGPKVNAIYSASISDDGKAVLMELEHGAKVNVVFTVNLPVANFSGKTLLSDSIESEAPELSSEDNLFNSALLSIGMGGSDSVVATNYSETALSDIVGVYMTDDLEYYELKDKTGPDSDDNRTMFDLLSEKEYLPSLGWVNPNA
ncbi:MAG: hypothetical protein LBT59_17020 [Clostridiales bacterium]|nr:hypothetical protein [Clostridiales bacterium]